MRLWLLPITKARAIHWGWKAEVLVLCFFSQVSPLENATILQARSTAAPSHVDKMIGLSRVPMM